MAHFWQGNFWSAFRTGDWLTAARARGYSMILLIAVWLVASFAAYLAMLRAIRLRGETLLIAAAYPAVFINFGHGQNGFLTAALLATHYVLDYDLVVLAVAIAFSARHGSSVPCRVRQDPAYPGPYVGRVPPTFLTAA